MSAQSDNQLSFDTAVFSFVAIVGCETEVEILSQIDFLLIMTKWYSRISRCCCTGAVQYISVLSEGCSNLYMHTSR